MVENSVAYGTLQTYNRGVLTLARFRTNFGLTHIWPIPLNQICNFIAYLYQENLSHSTVKCYLAGISFYSRIYDFEDATQKFVVKKMMEGFRRQKAPGSDLRFPICKELLKKLVLVLPQVCKSKYEARLFQAAFTLAYHGLLRIGEIAISKGRENHIISISDVSVSLEGLRVRVPSSKTDQIGAGAMLSLKYQNDHQICPGILVKQYIVDRPPYQGPLFCHFNGSPLTRYQFISVLKKSLECIGVKHDRFSSHSFRIGRATSLAMEGISDIEIMRLGRWKSNAYKGYIRPIV